MGEESGVPVGLFFYYYFFRTARKQNVNEEGVYMAVLFTSIRK